MHSDVGTGGAVALGQANSRSINFYGSWYNTDAGTGFYQFTDFFDSSFNGLNNNGAIIPATKGQTNVADGGSRVINGTFLSTVSSGGGKIIALYSPLEVAEGVALNGMTYETVSYTHLTLPTKRIV